ncbi:ferredoxin [Candidatus Parcubacteria bacterium]|jgi:ferredoxin|nr:ferredoxin [Candidatus Parcubacteria bacterium]MBT7228300.1 ferredoxin [Candidatus Parcubacteria bacterium]
MKKYKITLNKEDCIGCMTCSAVCEKIFTPSDDGKVSVTTDEITEETFDCVQQAIEACPIEVLKIEEIK